MDQSNDADRVIPLVNKLPSKKQLKVYKRSGESKPTATKVPKPVKQPPKHRTPKKSLSESSSHEGE